MKVSYFLPIKFFSGPGKGVLAQLLLLTVFMNLTLLFFDRINGLSVYTMLNFQ